MRTKEGVQPDDDQDSGITGKSDSAEETYNNALIESFNNRVIVNVPDAKNTDKTGPIISPSGPEEPTD